MAETNNEPKVGDSDQGVQQTEGPPTPSADSQSSNQWFNSYFGSEWMAKAKEHVNLPLNIPVNSIF